MVTKSVEQAEVVIIGGGILGASIAYHYTRQFPGRVMVLELQLHESLDLHQVGSLHVAASRQREQELRELVILATAAGIRHYIADLSTYTPDGLFVLGAVPAIQGFLAATGCNGAGIAAAGGIGLSIAALAAGRPAPWDLIPFRPERFGTIDPFSAEFRRRCEQARSLKVSG